MNENGKITTTIGAEDWHPNRATQIIIDVSTWFIFMKMTGIILLGLEMFLFIPVLRTVYTHFPLPLYMRQRSSYIMAFARLLWWFAIPAVLYYIAYPPRLIERLYRFIFGKDEEEETE